MICPWALKDEFLKAYHDEEWCRPHHDDTYLFEMLVLEGAQAGLSWSTILKRREGYRKTFFHFDISRCAGMTRRWKKSEERRLSYETDEK